MNKKSNKIVIAVIGVLFALTIAIIPLKQNTVSASTSSLYDISYNAEFIKKHDYTVSLGNIFFFKVDNSGTHRITETTVLPIYLSFDKDFMTTYFSYPTVIDNVVNYATISTINEGNSERYKYRFIDINNIASYVSYDERYIHDYSDLSYTFFNLSLIEINIPRTFANTQVGIKQWYDSCSLYRNSFNTILTYDHFGMNNGKYQKQNTVLYKETVDSPTLSIYYTHSHNDVAFDGQIQAGDFTHGFINAKYDRSEYIIKEIVEVEVPTYEWGLFETIKQGMNKILDIQILPNFYIHNILQIALGITLLGFVLHIVIK